MCQNAFIDDLRELLLIKDITPEMYWGTAENSLAAGAEPTVVDEGEESLNYAYALVDLFTPISLGYININTANEEVLQLVPLPGDPMGYCGVNSEHARDWMASTERRMMSRLTTYSSCSKCRVLLKTAANAARFMSVRSSTFEVRVTAEVRKQQRTLAAVLQRKNPKDIKILYTYWE